MTERPTHDSAGVNHRLKGTFDLDRAEWRSSVAGGDIEVAFVDELIGMRNAQDPDGPVLVFTEDEWEAFLAGAKDGEFDPEELEIPLT
ncbi:protein of unknown function [Actinopolymorpha cephalotaxi]|uniref:DUF397 domain-containing protein n=1 Tax=Actinopolymorpha cephalotaxi TaxID=504797 RepID=A0A1I3AIC3_9ACTN|nr:DUF397 domain-containing protein [Actinopolymorpha cephalotaxi]NYH82170.1 hypothetical protein [Actinopolymorpha cephalotaxi]SFH49752.1 protein of unknown function [Actinopolymorpha cephalotaxi]